jgi:hypothetical protein
MLGLFPVTVEFFDCLVIFFSCYLQFQYFHKGYFFNKKNIIHNFALLYVEVIKKGSIPDTMRLKALAEYLVRR